MKLLIATVTALSLFAGAVTPAFADRRDNDRQEWRGDHDRDRRDDRRDSRRDDRHHDRRDHDRHDDRRDGWQRDHRFNERNYRSDSFDRRHEERRFHAPRYIAPRGYHARAWHRGDRLPAAYYSSRYIVRDYHTYRLYAPPRGHHWVRVDNDVLLTAIATGAVVAVVGGLFH